MRSLLRYVDSRPGDPAENRKVSMPNLGPLARMFDPATSPPEPSDDRRAMNEAAVRDRVENALFVVTMFKNGNSTPLTKTAAAVLISPRQVLTALHSVSPFRFDETYDTATIFLLPASEHPKYLHCVRKLRKKLGDEAFAHMQAVSQCSPEVQFVTTSDGLRRFWEVYRSHVFDLEEGSFVEFALELKKMRQYWRVCACNHLASDAKDVVGLSNLSSNLKTEHRFSVDMAALTFSPSLEWPRDIAILRGLVFPTFGGCLNGVFSVRSLPCVRKAELEACVTRLSYLSEREGVEEDTREDEDGDEDEDGEEEGEEEGEKGEQAIAAAKILERVHARTYVFRNDNSQCPSNATIFRFKDEDSDSSSSSSDSLDDESGALRILTLMQRELPVPPQLHDSLLVELKLCVGGLSLQPAITTSYDPSSSGVCSVPAAPAFRESRRHAERAHCLFVMSGHSGCGIHPLLDLKEDDSFDVLASLQFLVGTLVKGGGHMVAITTSFSQEGLMFFYQTHAFLEAEKFIRGLYEPFEEPVDLLRTVVEDIRLRRRRVEPFPPVHFLKELHPLFATDSKMDRAVFDAKFRAYVVSKLYLKAFQALRDYRTEKTRRD